MELAPRSVKRCPLETDALEGLSTFCRLVIIIAGKGPAQSAFLAVLRLNDVATASSIVTTLQLYRQTSRSD